MTIELTEEESRMISYCIEYITGNERNFNHDDEKILESIADKFGAEYIAEANVNNENWGGKNDF